MNRKETKEALNWAKSLGFTVVDGKHHKVYDGPRLVATLACTASDYRVAKNFRSHIRQALKAREAQNEHA